jgi:hypothetical protein
VFTAFLQSSAQGVEGSAPQSAADLLADLVGCCEAVIVETCFLLKRSGFDPSLALQFIERGIVQLSFVLQEQIGSVGSLFKRYENVAASLADAALIRLAEISDSPLLLTTDSGFHIYRRYGRQVIPLVCP